MNYVDIAILGFILIGMVKGLSKGFVVEVASLFALIFGLLGAILFSSAVNSFFNQYFSNQNIPSGIAFILTFILIIIGINLLAKFLTKILKMGALGGINKILGTLIGGIKYVILLSAIALVLDYFQFMFSFADDNPIEESLFYDPIKSVGDFVLEWLVGKRGLFV